MGFLK